MVRTRLEEQDIVRRWCMSAETFVQRIIGQVRYAVDEGHLTDEFLGKRFTRREVTEVVLQMTYNAMHIHAQFHWEAFDYGDFLAVCIPNYLRKYDRRDDRNGFGTMSHHLDSIIQMQEGDLEDRLVEREMTGKWFSPVISIVQRSVLHIEVYDWRAYQWTLQQADGRVRREQEDESSPFYVGG